MTKMKDGFNTLRQDDISLRAAIEGIRENNHPNGHRVLSERLARDPVFQDSGLVLLDTGLDRRQTDAIHIMLGRGFLPVDEAFSAGFTIGCAKKVTTASEKLYAQLSEHVFPLLSDLETIAIAVLKDAIKLAYVSNCVPLDRFDFSGWLEHPVKDIRRVIGLEPELLNSYYEVEKRRYPTSTASQQLRSVV